MDLSVNKSVKDFLRTKFQEWYSSEVFRVESYEPDEALGGSVAHADV